MELLQGELSSLKMALQLAEQQLHDSDMTRRKLHNTVQVSVGCVSATLRVRGV
jgi:hypothetical protein